MNVQPIDQPTIDEIKNLLVKAYNPHEIYLLGPYRANTLTISIVIILDNAKLRERFNLMIKGQDALIDINVPKNILVYTPEEFEEYSQDASTLSYLIKKYGQCIYAHA